MATKAKQQYVIIRANTAGCFAGILAAREGDCVTLKQSRRLWYWDGAASLSQLAQEGTSKPQNCKFPVAVDLQEIFGVTEILYVTETARKSIEGVPVWRQ
jgi:hypothetical protein